MKRQTLLFLLAVLVLLVFGGWYIYDQSDQSDLVTSIDVEMEDDLRFFLENQLSVWEAALAAHEQVGQSPDLELYTVTAFNAKQIGDLERSRNVYEEYFKVNSINHGAWHSYGGVLRRMGDLDGAERAYRKAIEIKPDVERYYRSLAGVLETQGRTTEVREVYETAIKNVGQTRALLVLLSRWYEEQGICDEALSHMEVAEQLETDPEIDAAIEEDLQRIKSTCE